jgi:Lon protease-like protein
MPGDRLPLFPLNVVLFPSSSLPLHIFEERYKTLINECIGRNKDFGINLLRPDGMEEVGCTASVIHVARRYDDGKMDIVVRGERIYRLVDFTDDSKPYAVGTVEYVTDLQQEVDTALVDDTVRLFRVLQQLASRAPLSATQITDALPRLSFVIAQKAGLDLDARQRLLETQDENARLELLRRHLTAMIPQLEKKEELERLTQNDGYL